MTSLVEKKSVYEEILEEDEDLVYLPFKGYDLRELTNDDFIRVLEENNDGNSKLDNFVLYEIVNRLEHEANSDNIKKFFDFLKNSDFDDFSRYARLGFTAIANQKNLVAEEALKRALDLCDTVEDVVSTCNRLAEMLRRRKADLHGYISSMDIFDYLRPGLGVKNVISLINVALLLVLNDECDDESWELADRFIELIEQDDLDEAYMWWMELAVNDEIEGFVVHLLLLRNGKIGRSCIGNIEDIFNAIKERCYIPNQYKYVVTPFEGDEEESGVFCMDDCMTEDDL